MKKKLIGVMIILTLLITSFSTVVHAATLINFVNVTVKPPVNGGNWTDAKFTPTLPNGANYQLDTSWPDGYTWTDKTNGNTVLNVGDKFEYGHVYILTVYLKTNNTNYEFQRNSGGTDYSVGVSTVQNATIKKFLPYEGERRYELGIEYEFGPCSVIKNITANIDAPVLGSTPSYSPSWSTASATSGAYGTVYPYKELDDNSTIIDGVSWYDITSSKVLKSTDKFYCTHAYRAYMHFYADTNYVLSTVDAVTSDLNVRINGTNATVSKIQGIGLHYAIEAYIDYPAAATSHGAMEWITTKEPTCTEKGAQSYVCSICGMPQGGGAIDATGHAYEPVTTKATLSKDGIIETKCSNCDDVCGYTTIFHPKTFKLSKSSFTYNGKVQKPSVTIKDSEGYTIDSSNYKLSYSNSSSKKVGEYTVKVTFKGDKYEGSKTLTYNIAPKGTSLSKLTAAKKAFKATWKAQKTETTGYEIQYSTDKNFKKGNKSSKIGKNKTTSTTIKKLKAKKKYYARIRTYKKVGKTTIYSSWSKSKNIKTK